MNNDNYSELKQREQDTQYLLTISNPGYSLDLFNDTSSLINLLTKPDLPTNRQEITKELLEHANSILDQSRLQLYDKQFSVYAELLEDCSQTQYLAVTVSWLKNFASTSTFIGLSKIQGKLRLHKNESSVFSRFFLPFF